MSFHFLFFFIGARAIRVALSISTIKDLTRSYHSIHDNQINQKIQDMIVLFECIKTTSILERLRLPHTYVSCCDVVMIEY